MIKIVIVDPTAADAGTDHEPGIRDRLPVFLERDAQVGYVAICPEKKRFLDLDTAVIQRKFDLLFLSGCQRDRLICRRDLIIAIVYQCIQILVVGRKPKGYLTRLRFRASSEMS